MGYRDEFMRNVCGLIGCMCDIACTCLLFVPSYSYLLRSFLFAVDAALLVIRFMKIDR